MTEDRAELVTDFTVVLEDVELMVIEGLNELEGDLVEERDARALPLGDELYDWDLVTQFVIES